MILGWPVPPGRSMKYDDYVIVNKMRSDAKRAAYLRSIIPVNVVLVEAWADE